jgi:hypothetical protein
MEKVKVIEVVMRKETTPLRKKIVAIVEDAIVFVST